MRRNCFTFLLVTSLKNHRMVPFQKVIPFPKKEFLPFLAIPLNSSLSQLKLKKWHKGMCSLGNWNLKELVMSCHKSHGQDIFHMHKAMVATTLQSIRTAHQQFYQKVMVSLAVASKPGTSTSDVSLLKIEWMTMNSMQIAVQQMTWLVIILQNHHRAQSF